MVIDLVTAAQILAGTTNTGSGHRDVVGGLNDGAARGGGAILRDVHAAE